jgi:hypothetical protein
MLTLTDRGALRRAIRDPALDPHLRAVLRLRYDQLGGVGADFHLIQTGDSLADVEAAVGFPMTVEDMPMWEWTRRHAGEIVEVTFILSDDGPAQVLLVPDDADPAITDLLREHAVG